MKHINGDHYISDKEISLPGIFGTQNLQNLIQQLSTATDFSFSVIDYRGKSVINETICNSYCEEHKDLRECSECQLTAAYAAAKAAIKCCPYMFECPHGFSSIAVPIIVNEQYLGAVVGGRVYCLHDSDGNSAAGSDSIIYSDDVDAKDSKLRDQVPVLPKSKIMAIGNLIFTVLKDMGEKENLRRSLTTMSESRTQVREYKTWIASLREELEKIEFRHLNNRIPPQFMLNMLTTIANYAVLEDASGTEELVINIAAIMRYYLDETSELVTIESELAQLERYLFVLRTRLDKRFDYHIKLSEDCKETKIPVLILFSLLGYVINYGIIPSSYRSVLFLDVESDGDYCGVTMQMENRNKTLQDQLPEPGRIMGDTQLRLQLEDIDKRLKYFYGDHYKLNLGRGIVTLRLDKTLL